jgi:lipoyl(octanoyl) transferase
MNIELLFLGRVRFGDCLQQMENLHRDIVAGNQQPVILVLEHLPVVTMGQRKLHDDLLFRPEQANFAGFDYFEIDRGGSATAHEPGQLVVYPLLPIRLFQSSVRRYVHFLEDVVIQTCAHYGVTVSRSEENPGVWSGRSKIAAVGVRVKDKVTKHGLAFNITNSLDAFASIVPCGLRAAGVTTLAREIRQQQPEFAVSGRLNFSSFASSRAVESEDDLFFKDVRSVFVNEVEQKSRDCFSSPVTFTHGKSGD